MGSEKVTALETVRPQPTTALAPYEPRNFEEAMRLATVYASSGMLGEVRSNEAAFLIMSTGAELGIPATAALRSIHIIEGKPALSADLMVAMCLKARDVCEYFICTESNETKATYETKRVGSPRAVSRTFTIEDSHRAKLGMSFDRAKGTYSVSPGSNWSKYPRTMLRKRAAAELAREVYPDITLGLYSEAEEDALRQGFDITPVQQLVTEPVRAAAPKAEALSDAVDRWTGALTNAQTVAECDAIGAEMGKRLVKGTEQHAEMAAVYKLRVKEIKATAKVATAAPKEETTVVQDAEIVTEREAGEEG